MALHPPDARLAERLRDPSATSALVISANIVVTSVTPAMISPIPKICRAVDWWAKEKSPKPTVAKVSTVK